MNTRRCLMSRLVVFWLVSTAILVLSGRAFAEAAGDLFLISEEPVSQDFLHGAVADARRIEVDASQLSEGRERLGFALLDGSRHEATMSDLERRGPSDVTWRGWLDRAGNHRVVLTLQRSLVTGMVFSPEGVYEIAPIPGGGHRLAKLDQDRFPPCGGDPTFPGSLANPAEEPLPAEADPANQIDVLILYTPQARDAAGGVASIQATAQAAVDIANTAFADSGMTARFVLVGTSLAGHNDSGDISSDLSWLRTDAGVAALRNQVQADMVSLLVEDAPGACGVGYVMRSPSSSFASFAFQVTVRDCAVGNLTWAHEHGHNMGMEHNPENGTAPGNASYPWSFGHYVNGVFRTVMSYADPCPSGCTRVPRFSNPGVSYSGHPTGIANQRDNHRTGDLTAPIVANFRLRGSNSAPNVPSNPNPGSGAANVAVTTNLSWTGGDPNAGDTVTYDVYLEAGDLTPDLLICDNTTATFCDPPGNLSSGSTYYWRVDAMDNHGAQTIGTTWSFLTSGTSTGLCTPDWTLSCGDLDTWANNGSGSTAAITSYPCLPWSYSGPEYTYVFDAPGNTHVQLSLSGLSADLDLIVLRDTGTGCNSGGCISHNVAGGSDSELVKLGVLAGHRYYVVVDGYTGATSPYTVQLTCDGPLFEDVPNGHQFQNEITALYNARVTTGCNPSPRRYCPLDYVTRADMAVFVERSLYGRYFAPPPAVGFFADVPLSDWRAPWIEQFYNDGITQGCNPSPLQYCPLSNVTRAEMAVFLLRARYGASYSPPAATGVFGDVPVSHWAARWIEQFYRDGITGGCSANPRLYCPEDSVTRQAMAAFLVRTFGLPLP